MQAESSTAVSVLLSDHCSEMGTLYLKVGKEKMGGPTLGINYNVSKNLDLP